jgi:uncharacterized protein YutD
MTTNYKVTVYNDMGHLMTHSYYDEIPTEIIELIGIKTRQHLDYATDLTNYGCTFYILKDWVKNDWTYTIDAQTTLTLHYNVDTFNPSTMRMLR